jgi:uncharacterized protein
MPELTFFRQNPKSLPRDGAGPASRPPVIHLLGPSSRLAFVVDRSRLFAVDAETYAALEQGDVEALEALMPANNAVLATRGAPPLLPPNAISLNIAQSCNLTCSYCYADEGRFGGSARRMPADVARAAIDQLIDHAKAGTRVTVGFIGGEPFLNREVLYDAVEYAASRAHTAGIRVEFSTTTNGTLVTAADIDLLRRHRFALSISLDGNALLNDAHRKARSGESSFDAALRSLLPLLRNPGHTKLAARATITRTDLRVATRVSALIAAGFPEVGVSPLRVSPSPELAFRDEDWATFLSEMIQAAEADWAAAVVIGRFRFSNLANALKQIHAGYAKPLPCGAAASYVSVGAAGEYFTCHRTIDNPRFQIGDVHSGPDQARRETFLRSRHVDRQVPCATCWARYLCGGGCHAEVMSNGRSGCDYIRGWLEYCLKLYDRTLHVCPSLIDSGTP